MSIARPASVLSAVMGLALGWHSCSLAQDHREAAVGVHLISAHDRPGFQARNVGAYYRWASGGTVGAFRNSYGRDSLYAGWLWEADRAGTFGIFLGGATGYGSTAERMDLAPIFAPTLRWRPSGERWGLRLSWFADPRAGAAQVLHLSVEFGLPN